MALVTAPALKTPLYALSIREVARRIAIGELSGEAYTGALLDRIAQLEPEIHAWVTLDGAAALEAARRLDEKRDTGHFLGPLHGLPIGVKDILLTRGVPTRMGSMAYANYIPDHNAEIVDRLEAAGGFSLGKTVTTECAFMVPNAVAQARRGKGARQGTEP